MKIIKLTCISITFFVTTPWFWEITRQNLYVGGLVVFTIIQLLLFTQRSRNLNLTLGIISLIAIISWQLATTSKQNLTYLDNDQQRGQQSYLNAYPPLYFEINDRKFYIPLAHWLESRPETVAWYRIKSNFFYLLDLGVYFFAGHPRETPGIAPTEKIFFIWLPFFLLGLWQLSKSLRGKLIPGISLCIVIIYSVWGIKNPFGLLPLISFVIITGLRVISSEASTSRENLS